MDTFRSELEQLINHHSIENGSNTPSFILAEYMHRSLELFDATVGARDKWYGIEPAPGWREAPRASGLDEFVSAHATRDGEIVHAAELLSVLPPVATERCPGSLRVVGPREGSTGQVRCFTCTQVVVTEISGINYVVATHSRVVAG